jgi:bacterial/archaeal transporter family protein
MQSQYFIVLAILGWGLGSFLQKFATDHMHPLMISATITVFCMVIMPLAFIFLKFDKSINAVGALTGLLAGACMCLGTLGYLYALRGNHAGITTVLTALYPAITLILSMIFLGEQLNIKQVVGLCLALASFVLLSLK